MNGLLSHVPPIIRVNSVRDKASPPSQRCSTPKKPAKKPQKKAALPPIARLIHDTSNLLLSLRDGLTESEREQKRRTEERMQILAARMHNVSSRAPAAPPWSCQSR